MEDQNENQLQKAETAALQTIDPNSPAGLMEQMMSHGGDLDVDAFGKMLEYQAKHEDRQAKKAYVVAMAKFKENPPVVVKDRHVKFETKTGTTEYDHVTLHNATTAINGKLSEHGLSSSWITGQVDGGIKVTCKITHVLGHSEETSLVAPPDASGGKNPIQAIASTVSYLERYTLFAIAGIAGKDQDDDGATAGKKKPTIPKLTEANMKAVKTIANELPQIEGKIIDVKKLAAVIFTKWNAYPTDLTKSGATAEAIVQAGLDKPEIYIDAPGDDLGDIDNG